MPIIAVIGIPGSGKSSTVQELSKISDYKCFLEPEETAWPEIVSNREHYGKFTGITWFRGVRVKQLVDAQDISDKGGTAVLDTYFDKLIHLYLNKPGMNWLISPKDPYFQATQTMAAADYQNLPNADLVIGLHLSQDKWNQFVNTRGRALDKDPAFAQECFTLQEHLLGAAQQYATEHGKEYLELEQNFTSPEAAAATLLTIIRDHTAIQNHTTNFHVQQTKQQDETICTPNFTPTV